MNNYKNNYRKNRFKSGGDRIFRKRNGNGHKINGEFNSNSDFRRRNPGRNNQNASKLIDKYNDLAREALSNGDKILSENYLQHSDHFSRIQIIQESSREAEINSKKLDEKKISNEVNSQEKIIVEDENIIKK